MRNTDDILNRLKEKLDFKSDTELAKYMNLSTGTIPNWRKRNKIPYDDIFTICENENINIKFVFYGQIERNECPEIDYKEEIHKMIDDLDCKKSEVYYHLIKAEILKENL